MAFTDTYFTMTTFGDLSGDSVDLLDYLHDNTKNGWINFSEDDNRVDVIIVEELEWHKKHNAERMNKLTDEEGWLTENTRKTIARNLSKIVNGSCDIELTESDAYPDIPSVAFVASYYVVPEATLDEFYDTFWGFYAQVINVTDPGTFNSPYVFGTLADPSAD